MPDYQINVTIECEALTDDEARELRDNTRRVLHQFWPKHSVSVSVFGKPLDIFSRRVA